MKLPILFLTVFTVVCPVIGMEQDNDNNNNNSNDALVQAPLSFLALPEELKLKIITLVKMTAPDTFMAGVCREFCRLANDESISKLQAAAKCRLSQIAKGIGVLEAACMENVPCGLTVFLKNIAKAKMIEAPEKRDILNRLLMIAAKHGATDVASMLIRNGAYASGVKGDFPLCALANAAWKIPTVIALNMAQLLLEHGAEVNTQDSFGVTPLHGAVKSESIDMIRLLLQHEAKVNTTDSGGASPLCESIFMGKENLAQLLLDHGADANGTFVTEDSNDSMLHRAARFGHLPMVRLLLDRGANPHYKDIADCKASAVAKNNEVRDLLLKYEQEKSK